MGPTSEAASSSSMRHALAAEFALTNHEHRVPRRSVFLLLMWVSQRR